MLMLDKIKKERDIHAKRGTVDRYAFVWIDLSVSFDPVVGVAVVAGRRLSVGKGTSYKVAKVKKCQGVSFISHLQDEMKLYYVCTAEGCGYRWTE